MGKLLRQLTRESNIVARYGGDEFVVILPQTTADEANSVGERILTCLADAGTGAGRGTSLRSSAGTSVLAAHDFVIADIPHPLAPTYFQDIARSLIRQADEALYEAKRQGRGRLCRGATTIWGPLA